MMKKLTFAISCYNFGEYIEECLLSILSQKTNFDFDIVDIFDYLDKSLILYKSNTNFNFISPITLQANQVVEFKYNIGIKNQNGNKLEFFQNKFNYIENQTFIKFNE